MDSKQEVFDFANDKKLKKVLESVDNLTDAIQTLQNVNLGEFK